MQTHIFYIDVNQIIFGVLSALVNDPTVALELITLLPRFTLRLSKRQEKPVKLPSQSLDVKIEFILEHGRKIPCLKRGEFL